MLPSSRAKAKATGSTYYYTGKPCKYQHIAKRLTSSGECSECFKVRDKARSASPAAKERRRAYYKDYQVRKAEAIREYRKTRRPKHIMTEEQLQRKVRHNARYRAARTQSIPSWYDEWDEFVMLEAIALAAEGAKCTGIAWHVDHMIPLKAKEVCGLHCAGNIQVIPATLNTHKCNRLLFTEPLEWLKA